MLIGSLVAGAVDVVGDVHGEDAVLAALLGKLGYDDAGRHPAGRRLVFVGDLIDRGPDSLRVVDRVRTLVEAGRAQCVLGNHELNVLRGEHKDGNDWFFTRTAAEQGRALEFFATLPLALERDDLRVVHACWHDRHVDRLRGARGSVVDLAEQFRVEIDAALVREGLPTEADDGLEAALRDPAAPPALAPALVAAGLRHQVDHPIRVLTSGLETAVAAPFFVGRWRFEQRVPWWHDYAGAATCVIGHYWRSPVARVHHGKGPDLFAGVAPFEPLGPRQRVVCVDYSIGHRARERAAGARRFRTALAAYRFPEREVERVE